MVCRFGDRMNLATPHSLCHFRQAKGQTGKCTQCTLHLPRTTERRSLPRQKKEKSRSKPFPRQMLAAWSKEEQKYVDAAKEWSDRTEQWPSDFEFDIIPTSNIPVTLEDGILHSQISSTKTVEEHGRGAIWLKLSENPSDTMVMMAVQTGGVRGIVRIGDKYGRWKFARTKEGKITVIPKKTKS
ncbi:hypothetical protein FB446DRAFT_191002 [Lentinula raphanica]|nr:hypothetical protein FB446DRAFT_191002 [Lentinula raphanica]